MNKDFDRTNEYKNSIEPLLQEIRAKCYAAEIPFFFLAAVADAKGVTEYKSEIVDTYPNGISLSNDVFPKLLNVMNGFDTIPPSAPMEMDFN